MRRLQTKLLAALVILPSLAVQSLADMDQPAHSAALVREWNTMAINCVRQQTLPPGLTSRNMAILHLAMFEAANADERAFHSYIGDLPAVPEDFVPELAVMAAAARTMELLFAEQAGRVRGTLSDQREQLGLSHAPSEDFGRRVAESVIRTRSNDGSATSITYVPETEVGRWQRTPPSDRPPEAPHWARVRPFCLEDPDFFMPPGPPPLDSPEYAAAVEEVRRLGAVESEERTPYQTETARFWACFNYTGTPAGHWNEIAARLAVDRRLDLVGSCRLMALLNIALNDAGIVAWKAKYGYRFWRPIHAIRQANGDGNPSTREDSGWNSLLEAPPHPEYVSGHSSYTGAGAEILRRFFGTDEVKFSTGSDSLPGVIRSYSSLRSCEEEIGRSRIYGGIHFQFSNRDGLDLGHRVAGEVFLHSLTRTGKPAMASRD